MTGQPRALRSAQQGLALITAVLVVAIVATVATTLALGEQVWFRQVQNITNRAQADSLRQGALNYAALLLTLDGQQNSIDHLDEAWAKPLPPLPVEDGMIAFSVYDAQGQFNLNNLVKGTTNIDEYKKIFRRLLVSLQMDPVLGATLQDWMDSDSDVNGGAEDTDYLSLPQPYRSANQPLTSVDELRLVKGFSANEVEKLRPYVTVITGPAPINVNTAPDRVLAALFDNLPAQALQGLLESRVKDPIKQKSLLKDRVPAGTALPKDGVYDVKTGHFMVTLDIRYGRLQRRTEAMINRPGGKKATVLWHRTPPLQFETK